MTTKFKNLIELTAYFKSEAKCIEHLEQLRWANGRYCPHCASVKTYQCKQAGKYICGDCKQRFSVTKGTFFENTKIPLSKWFVAMYLCFSHKKGISSCQLARDLSITQKAAWHVLHRIRSLVVANAPDMLWKGMVEADATFIGGKEKWKHADKKVRKDGQFGGNSGYAATADKTAVFGMVERGGNVVTKHVASEKKENVQDYIFEYVSKSARLITDEHHAYRDLKKKYRKHQLINHSEKQYVVGDVHTNTIENYWSVLKRTIHGTYHQVSAKHIAKYLNESAFRYNTRTQTEQQRFDLAVSKCANGRLTYKTLINNENRPGAIPKGKSFSKIVGGK
ncbi:MAG: IS1595 family transposase [Bacteroidia bacterium]